MDSFALLKFWHHTSPSHHVATRDGSDPEDDDDGPFFDLEFDVSDDEEGKGLYPVDNASASEGDHEGEDDTDCGCLDHECSDHPDDSSDCTSDDDHIFFKGDLLLISPSTDDVTTPKTAHFPVSLLKSSARLRVLMSGLKKPVSQENTGNGKPESEPRQNIRRLFIKFKVEEKPPVSLFTRDNTKPSLAKTVTGVRARLRVVFRQGKSRFGSSAMDAAPGASTVASRRDDSLLQQQDGIQGAILHCKSSFNNSRDLDLVGFRKSASDPSHKKLMESAGRE